MGKGLGVQCGRQVVSKKGYRDTGIQGYRDTGIQSNYPSLDLYSLKSFSFRL